MRRSSGGGRSARPCRAIRRPRPQSGGGQPFAFTSLTVRWGVGVGRGYRGSAQERYVLYSGRRRFRAAVGPEVHGPMRHEPHGEEPGVRRGGPGRGRRGRRCRNVAVRVRCGTARTDTRDAIRRLVATLGQRLAAARRSLLFGTDRMAQTPTCARRDRDLRTPALGKTIARGFFGVGAQGEHALGSARTGAKGRRARGRQFRLRATYGGGTEGIAYSGRRAGSSPARDESRAAQRLARRRVGIMSAAVEATPRKLVMAAPAPRTHSGLRPCRGEA